MIESRNLRFSYTPARSFTFPDLRCADREALLILGRSGSGKTTLLHLLGLLLRPNAGQILLDGEEVSGLAPARTTRVRAEKIGIVYQKPHFVKSLSVQENLLLANYLADRKHDVGRARSLAGQLGFAGHLDKKTNQLSQGEQQRVGIARALMNKPSLLLADEPTASLDDENCRRVVALLREQSQAAGASLVVVTHDQRLKDEFANRVEL